MKKILARIFFVVIPAAIFALPLWAMLGDGLFAIVVFATFVFIGLDLTQPHSERGES